MFRLTFWDVVLQVFMICKLKRVWEKCEWKKRGCHNTNETAAIKANVSLCEVAGSHRAKPYTYNKDQPGAHVALWLKVSSFSASFRVRGKRAGASLGLEPRASSAMISNSPRSSIRFFSFSSRFVHFILASRFFSLVFAALSQSFWGVRVKRLNYCSAHGFGHTAPPPISRATHFVCSHLLATIFECFHEKCSEFINVIFIQPRVMSISKLEQLDKPRKQLWD